MKLFYCRVGWMNAYRGSTDERPQNGGAYNRENIGHEVYNYLGTDGKYYGFVQSGKYNNIHIDRLGAGKKDDSVENILVVWVSSHPEKRGQYIIGWYEDAVVYKEIQTVPVDVMECRNLKTHDFYNIFSENVTLLNVDERTYQLKGMGQSNVWYGNEETDAAVYGYIQKQMRQRDNKISSIEKESIEGSEKEALVKIRINQNVFRQKLIEKYHRCALCRIENPKLLVASHIKPWSISDKHEKLDVSNGLLLCPNHDRLFDSGLISFDDDGKIMISSELTLNDQIFSHTNLDIKVTMDEDMRIYMKYHRENIFKK